MVQRYESSEQLEVATPNPQSAIIGTSGLDATIRGLNAFVEKTSNILDRRTIAKAKRAGALAGLQPDFAPMDGSSLYAEEFNNAGVETFVNKSVVDASTTVHKLAMDPKFASDPIALQEQLGDIRTAILANLPPDAVPHVSLAFDRNAAQAINNSQTRAFEEQKSELSASFKDMEKGLFRDLSVAARNANVEAVTGFQSLYLERLRAHAPVSMGGNGALSADEYYTKKEAINQTVKRETFIGDFMRTPDEDKPRFIEEMVQKLSADTQSVDNVWKAMLNQESGGDHYWADGTVKVSSDGATGIAQVMEGTGPEAAALAGVPWDRNKWQNDPAYNEKIGRAYFEEQLRTFGDVEKALAAYNAGPHTVRKAEEYAERAGKPETWKQAMTHFQSDDNFKQTQDYIRNIMAKSQASGHLFASSEIDELVQQMNTTYNTHITAQSRADEQAEEEGKRLALELEKKFVEDPSLENYNALLDNSYADSPFQYQQYMQNAVTQSDPVAMRDLSDKLARGQLTYQDISFIGEDGQPRTDVPRLTQKDRMYLAEQLTLQQSGGGFEQTPVYGEFLKRVDEDFAVLSEYGGKVVDEQGEALRRQVYDWMRDQYPKYQRGEAEMPDPIKKYTSLYNQWKSARGVAEAAKTTVNSLGKKVIIDQRYIDNPSLYEYDKKNDRLSPDLDDPYVEKAIEDAYIANQREATNG